MVDKVTLAKARQELEELYRGIPDDSVDLTFKDFGSSQHEPVQERKKTSNMDPINEEPAAMTRDPRTTQRSLRKEPSLDFSRAIQEARDMSSQGSYYTSRNSSEGSRAMLDVSRNNSTHEYYMSDGGSTLSSPMGAEKAKKRRPGIPHSNLCALCKEYIYIFRTRCLVCGRVYCRGCVGQGMGEMSEGRKCVDCLGQRFSQRYIERAGKTGCCWRYPSTVKLQELKWAEKGPRRSGENQYRNNRVASRSQSPVNFASSRSPVMGRAGNYASDDPPSFLARSTFSPHY